MNVAVCCIGRQENKYIREYVEHYQNIGVDKIFLYDNNYDGEEYFEEVIQDYIDSGFVDITNFRNKSICQMESYQNCYNLHGNEFDWILFIDCGDEYLYMEHFANIKDFLSQDKFNKFDVIHINLMTYGDSGLVKYDDKKLSERFTTPVLPLDFKKSYDFPENDHVSSIVRGHLPWVRWNATPHTPNNVLRCCDASGRPVVSTSPFVHPFDFSEAHFKHYTTKTLEEWIEIKTKRGYPDGNKDYFKRNDIFKTFFKVNEMNDEKLSYIINDTSNNDNINIVIVNYNTQELTDTCIKSVNKTTPNANIFVFDNSDKQPFKNTFKNVTVIDNTQGRVIDFNGWLSHYPQKDPMLNKYGSAKHIFTIQKIMDLFNGNFILLDSDVLVKKDLHELYDDECIFVGEKLPILAFWKERIAPYVCFINNKICKQHNVKYFDEKRCTQITRGGYNYDTGASFAEDAMKYKHRLIKTDDYIIHYAAGSWNTSNKKKSVQEWLNENRRLWV